MKNETTLFGRILTTALRIPKVKVDREKFLKSELSPYYTKEYIDEIAEGRAVIDSKVREKAVNQCMSYHIKRVCGLSALAGLPGGWWIAGTIPADITQFYSHMLMFTQKMLYLYGWGDLYDSNGKLRSEANDFLTLWIGVMMGSSLANSTIKSTLASTSMMVLKQLPPKGVINTAIINAASTVCRWIGVELSKGSATRYVGKIIPLLGAPISAAITYLSFKPMALRLKKMLDKNTPEIELPPPLPVTETT